MSGGRFDECIEPVLVLEGAPPGSTGYVNDKYDKGGETKFGISKRAYPKVDIKNLTRDGAKNIYFVDYWLPAHCYELPIPLDLLILDARVTHRPKTAAKLLQAAVGAKPDGIIGPLTIAAARTANIGQAMERYFLERKEFFLAIVESDDSQVRFLKGWLNRLKRLRNFADKQLAAALPAAA